MDCILINGNVLTQEGGRTAEAVAVRDGRIAAVGESAALSALAGEQTRRIDLRGRTVVPGFEDAHAHVWKMGHLLTTMVDLRPCCSLDEIGDRLSARRKELPEGAWLQGRGFNEAQLKERRRPTRDDLDRWVPDRPALLTRTCGHVFVANSAALRLAGIDRSTVAPGGGSIQHDERGEPNGILEETAVGLVQRVLPAPSREDYAAMVVAALRHQASRGITSSSDCGVLPELLATYMELDSRGALPVRMTVMPLGRPDGASGPLRLPRRHCSDFLRVDTVKFLADGGLSGATAALSVPYRDSSSTGVLRFGEADLRGLFRQAREEGWRIATHAIGDVAIEQVLSLYEELGPAQDGAADRIEHLGLPTPAQLRRAAALGIFSVTQAIFLRELGRNFVASLPAELLARVYPLRGMLDAGVPVALSSDAPVVEDDSPLAGMHAAVTRKTREGLELSPEQIISAGEALLGYTRGGAAAAGEAATRGAILPGMWADLAVLSDDPTGVAADALLEIRVEMTMVAGEIVYSRTTEGAWRG